MKTTNYQLPESTIIEGREDLLSDITTFGSATINSKSVSVHDLLEDADTEDMANIIAMLMVDKSDAYYHAIEILTKRFDDMFDDGEIEDHLIDEACEL